LSRSRSRHFVAAGAVLAFAAALAFAATGDSRVSLWLVTGAVLAVVAVWLESGPDSAKHIALIATLAGVAAAGRVLFAAIPGVQPVTVIALVAGAALGLRAGIGVGMLAAFVSNFFLGQGPWTAYQMLAWGACGAVGALLGPLLRRRMVLVVVAFVCGLAFSTFMDVWEWFAFWPHDWQSLTFLVARGLPFSIAHALGNVVLALAVGPELRRLLHRYGRRLETEVVWAS
jgi:energy-coupling factor transport system substrate-specific component